MKALLHAALAKLERFRRDDGGAVIVIAVLALPLFVGTLGLGAEAGYWFMSQRQLQHAADIAAHAGAIQLQAGGTLTQMRTSALDVASASGYKTETDASFTLNSPPTSGAKVGDKMSVEVVMSRSHTPMFSALFRSQPVVAGARAVASVQWSGAQACVLALNATASGAVTVSGSTSVTLTNCDVASNSNAADGFLMSSSSAPVRAKCVYSVGGAVTNANLTLDCGAPVTNSKPTRDPYASVAEPTVSGTCQNISTSSNGTTTLTPTVIGPDGVPRMYLCALTVKGNLVLNSGLYIIDGLKPLGGSTSSTTDVTISSAPGAGVTLYFTSGATVSLTARTTLDLKAPTTGPYSGLVFFGTRSGPLVTQQITGSASTRIQGSIYLPRASIEFVGSSSSTGGCTQLIGDTVIFKGNSQLSASCDLAGTSPIKSAEKAVLSE